MHMHISAETNLYDTSAPLCAYKPGGLRGNGAGGFGEEEAPYKLGVVLLRDEGQDQDWVRVTLNLTLTLIE